MYVEFFFFFFLVRRIISASIAFQCYAQILADTSQAALFKALCRSTERRHTNLLWGLSSCHLVFFMLENLWKVKPDANGLCVCERV